MIDAKKYIEEIDKKQDKLTSLSDEIWGYAETAFTEFQSVEALQKFFESEGFLVTPHAYGVETAFTAEYGSGTPRVGVLGEFDALSGLSQVSDLIEKKAVTEGASGHGCGHNCWVSVPQRQRWPSRNIWKMVMRERWFTMAVLVKKAVLVRHLWPEMEHLRIWILP